MMEKCNEQISDLVDEKRLKLRELESEWLEMEESFEQNKRGLEQSVGALYPDLYDQLMKRKEIESEMEMVLADIERRDREIVKLSSDLENQPKLAPRKSYIDRIKEITKNSRKQDSDVQNILKDTRELLLESNTIQERLNRTYAVVNERIFRESKKDPVAGQAYRLLTNVHESFEQIAEKIIATDRIHRKIADYEAKIAIIDSKSLNMEKLQADLNAIKKENNLLEQSFHSK